MLSRLQIYVRTQLRTYVAIQRVANYYLWRVLNCNLQLYYVQDTQQTKYVVYSHFCLYFGTSIYNLKHTQQKAMEHKKFRNCLTYAIRKSWYMLSQNITGTVHLFNYHGCPTILNGGFLVFMQKKPTQGIRGMQTWKQARFMQMELNIVLGKNGGYMLSSLDSRSISVSRQAVSEMKIYDSTTSIQ